MNRAVINPEYRHHCETGAYLGQVSINRQKADLFVCEGVVIARFSDDPQDYEASHLTSLTFESNPFLLVAFRL